MLATHERAELLGISMREYVDLARQDVRLFAEPVLRTPHAAARCRRWLAAGRPAADFSRLVYIGDADVRALLIATLGKLPPALAWHAVEFIAWFEVGRTTGAWTCCAPVRRAPSGDSPHLIVLNGGEANERMPHIVVHELAHSWHRPLFEDTQGVPMPPDERLALALSFDDADTLAHRYHAEEVLADATAKALGFSFGGHSSDDVRYRAIRDELASPSDRAAAINAGDR